MSLAAKNIPHFAEAKVLVGATNWPAFKNQVISAVRAAGHLGYLSGTIVNPAPAPTPAGGTAPAVVTTTTTTTPSTAPNSSSPSAEEWEMRDAWVAALIYQNIDDPDAHSLDPSSTSAVMWHSLTTRFDKSSELLKSRARERLRSARFVEGGLDSLSGFLGRLAKLQMEANALGCKVVDVEMIAILYAALPATFALAIQIHAGKTDYQEICAGLLEWWMITHPGEAEASLHWLRRLILP
ncbi:hypothetical protein BDZ89DRAFT_1136329 [Hymenopellis radicata]|nr:hypothetical protein BDZ89DRAFT_1136329 [Hymenopellis radicata]